MRSGSNRDDMLSLYAAGELDDTERDEVETWLQQQPDRAVRLAQAEHKVASLAAAGRPVASRRWIPAAVAAGLAGLLVGGGLVWMGQRTAQRAADALRADLETTRADLSATADVHDALDAELGDLEARTRSLESDLLFANKAIRVLRAEESESLALTGTEFAVEARGRVFWDWDTWYCYLHAVGLAPDSKTIYAIWLFTEDGVVGVGTFRADAAGEATFLGPVPHDVGFVLRAGVSIEPDEDLGAQPRGDIVMLGETDPERS